MAIKKKLISAVMVAVIILTSVISNFSTAFAEEENYISKDYNRIMFVVDCSNSMNYQDKDKLTNEIVKMFVDASLSTKTDIGLITYNDQILSTTSLLPMDNAENRNAIKNSIDSSTRVGSTDIGLALNTAMDTFINDPKENSKQAVVLISDGETDLKQSTTGRTMEDSKNDETEAIRKSQELGCPIYTVGVSKDGGLNTEYLTDISNNTGGKSYEIQNQSQLQTLFNTLFADVVDAAVMPNDVIIGTGSEQSISITIPKDYIYETNVLIGHSQPINGVSATQEDGSGATEINTSGYYTGVRIVDPSSNTINLKFTATSGDEIKISTVNFANVKPVIEMPSNLGNKEITINAHLYNTETNKLVTDEALYKSMAAELNLINTDSGETQTIPMDTTGAEFAVTLDNITPQAYDLKVTVSGQGYAIKSQVEHMEFSNSIPQQTITEKVNILKSDDPKEIDLNKSFKDIDGDNLTYELAENTLASEAEIQGDTLLLTPGIEETGSITMNVSDDRGETLTATLELDIMPFWEFYRNEILIIGCIFIILLILYLIFARKTKNTPVETIVTPSIGGQLFRGVRFEGYFLNTLSGNDVPVLFWNGNMIENKHSVSLGDLFSILDVPEKLPEAYKIYIEAGNNGKVIFYHNTKCIVSLGRRDVEAGKQEVLSFGDKLYIVFEDHVTEIEIRYKRVRKK